MLMTKRTNTLPKTSVTGSVLFGSGMIKKRHINQSNCISILNEFEIQTDVIKIFTEYILTYLAKSGISESFLIYYLYLFNKNIFCNSFAVWD